MVVRRPSSRDCAAAPWGTSAPRAIMARDRAVAGCQAANMGGMMPHSWGGTRRMRTPREPQSWGSGHAAQAGAAAPGQAEQVLGVAATRRHQVHQAAEVVAAGQFVDHAQ